MSNYVKFVAHKDDKEVYVGVNKAKRLNQCLVTVSTKRVLLAIVSMALIGIVLVVGASPSMLSL